MSEIKIKPASLLAGLDLEGQRPFTPEEGLTAEELATGEWEEPYGMIRALENLEAKYPMTAEEVEREAIVSQEEQDRRFGPIRPV